MDLKFRIAHKSLQEKETLVPICSHINSCTRNFFIFFLIRQDSNSTPLSGVKYDFTTMLYMHATT